ncbi:MAG: RHS repeat-associated core domain-containing protein [Gemmatimonadaceae bacterium]
MTGRFTQEDPIGLAGGLNLYGYAGGDPVNFSDPFRLCPSCAVAHSKGSSRSVQVFSMGLISRSQLSGTAKARRLMRNLP